MWFWIGMLLILLWGSWGYVRRHWWLREFDRSLDRASRDELLASARIGHHGPPGWRAMSDKALTAIAGAAAIIGVFLVVASYWGWFDTPAPV